MSAYPAKTVIFHEGDASRHVLEVVEGVIKLYKLTPDGRRQITGFVYPGQLLGLAYFDHYVQTAETVTDVKVCRFSRNSLEKMIGQQPKLARRLLALTTNELVMAQDQMLLLGRKNGLEKVVSFLLRLSEDNAERGEDPSELHLPMTRMDIGDYIGLSTETVSRLFSRLKELELIDLPDAKRVKLRDTAALRLMREADERCLAA